MSENTTMASKAEGRPMRYPEDDADKGGGPKIMSQLDFMGDTISKLNATMELLVNSISPVLGPEDTLPGADAMTERRGDNSEMSETIDVLNSRLRVLSSWMGATVRRVQI